jgi:SAM-dependent methyltransferase
MSNSQFTDLAAYYDELMDVVPYDFWAEYVMTLLNLVGSRPQTILDCACGTGNLSFELAKFGIQITGVDISLPMIAEARRKAADINLPFPILFHHGNLTSFNLGQTFDTATCLYDSLNYILDTDELTKAFSCIRKHLIRGGIFVFDLNSEWAFEANLFTQSSHKTGKTLHYDWQARFDTDTKICTVSMSFKRRDATGNETDFQEQHKERAYSIDEIEQILLKTGWELLHIFDAYTLNRPRRRSERWFFVAQAI